MTTTSLTITEANIGEMIGPPDGFLVNLTMTTGPVHETARWDEGRQKWLSAYFVLRGSHDLRDLVCVDAATNGHAFAWWGGDGRMLVNRSEPYAGALVVVAVPKGSQ